MRIDKRFTYTGRKTNEISFPLGGIGSGCIGLAGNGRLIDWEIANKPNKGSYNGLSHFAVRAEQAGKVIDARVLNGDLNPPYIGGLNSQDATYGLGASRKSMAGMPHFRDAEFTGTFPIAKIDFKDESFPGEVSLTAFNPFIPLNDNDSSIPAAFFEIEVRNNTTEPINYTVAGSLANLFPANNRHALIEKNSLNIVKLSTDCFAKDDLNFGDLSIATDSEQVSVQQYWYRGGWNDNLETYWRNFTTPGPLKDRIYTKDHIGKDDLATLAAHIFVPPDESKTARFVISWNFPNCTNTWNSLSLERAKASGIPEIWRNYYASLWKDSAASAAYALENWDRLWIGTKLFRDMLFASTLPAAAIDAISANISILKSPTVSRVEDGTFYGWEGCNATSGCCDGSCTHVWNYAQALPFLFPKLERGMREADYRYNLLPTGAMPFRIQLPLAVLHDPANSFRPCADGQFGGVMKVYRDWKICGDTDWLRSLWPSVKLSIEFAWHPGNLDRWDPETTGVLWGRQHHTLDMELFGPNSWLTGFYLGALKAGAEIAEIVGDHETALEYREIFARGRNWVDNNLFDGEYFKQKIDLTNRSIAEGFDALDYWSEEHGELKYQLGDGCSIDQTLAQWHSNLYGLGDILDPDQTLAALKSLYKNNFKKPMRDFYNPWRIYSLNDEAGLVIADWPKDMLKPAIPITYAQETMNGFEYSAAILMIQSGMVEEGETVVEAVRERYDGEKRNPWNEFECGSNYARSMASYALLNAYSGFEFDMDARHIGFAPIRFVDGQFRCFWSLDCAWGEYFETPDDAQIIVHYGAIPLRKITLSYTPKKAEMDGAKIAFSVDNHAISFANNISIIPNQPLRLLK